MNEQNLGPNGGIMYALEEVESSLGDFVNMIESLGKQDYLILTALAKLNYSRTIQRFIKSLNDWRNWIIGWPLLISLIHSILLPHHNTFRFYF